MKLAGRTERVTEWRWPTDSDKILKMVGITISVETAYCLPTTHRLCRKDGRNGGIKTKRKNI